MKDPVVPFDLWQMFIGEHPPLFYLEVLFRTLLTGIFGRTRPSGDSRRESDRLSVLS